MVRIDAHQHYWKLSRGDYDWMTPDMTALYRDFLPDDLLPALRRAGLDGTIVVQAAATHAETEFLLDLAGECDTILGVVGWIDFTSPARAEILAKFEKHPKWVGLRVMIEYMEDASVLASSAFLEMFRRLAETDTPVDLLMRVHQVPAVLDLLEREPRLRIVVDHLAKPDIGGRAFDRWSVSMAGLAAHPNVHAKLSGLVTEAGPDSLQLGEFQPYIARALETFGPERLMFGSDWPVCLQRASYDEVREIVSTQLPSGLSQAELAGIWGETAARFYKLGAPDRHRPTAN